MRWAGKEQWEYSETGEANECEKCAAWRVFSFPVKHPVSELRGSVVLVATWKLACRGIAEFVCLFGSSEESLDFSSALPLLWPRLPQAEMAEGNTLSLKYMWRSESVPGNQGLRSLNFRLAEAPEMCSMFCSPTSAAGKEAPAEQWGSGSPVSCPGCTARALLALPPAASNLLLELWPLSCRLIMC